MENAMISCKVYDELLHDLEKCQQEQISLQAINKELVKALEDIKYLSSIIPVKFQQSIWDIVNPALKLAKGGE